MKKKVRVKSLPKAQYGFNNLPAPNVLRPDYLATWKKNNPYPPFGNAPTSKPISADVYSGINNTSGNFNVGMPEFNLNTSPLYYSDAYQGDPNTTGSFNVGMPEFIQTSVGEPLVFDNNVNPFSNPLSLYPRNTKLESGILSTKDAIRKSYIDQIPEDTRKLMGLEPFGDIKTKKPEQQKGNPYVGQAILAGTDIFRGLANQIDNRFAKRDFRDQFLSDNLAYAREESQSGNSGDYNFNEFGFGPSFRPDDYIKGDYNKIAQMGGEMKRKVKITSLPQAGYGGSQNQNAVNQLYGNSAYMVNKFSGAEQEEQEPAYNQTLQPDPRSMAVLEAEKGETLIRKGTNSAIPEFFKIGGKRHSEGGTPLSGEKATPDSFIYSDTKAMKIKDPAILESFGFTAKKGGYTPAKISKKFDLNSKELREGLYSDSDPLRKKTAVMMADNYISNLGKLALVQESQKGFPQGVPQIAVPYMDKVGLDPAQFLPPSPEEGMAMAMYGGIPKAQNGISRMDGMAEFEKLKRNYYAGNPNTGITQRATPNVAVNRTTPYTAQDIEFKDGRWQVKPTANMQAAPYSVSSQNMSPQRFQDYTFNNPEAAIDLVIKSSGIPSYIERVDKGRQEFLNTLNQPFAKQQVDTIAPAPVKQPVVTQKAKPVAQTPKPKVNVAKPSTGFTAPDGSIVEFEYGGESLYQAGGEKGTFLAKHTDASGKEYSSYLQGDKVVLVDTNNEVVSTRPATEKDKPAISTYDTEEKKLLKSIAPNLILPEDYVEANQRGKVAKIPGTFGRFDKAGADKNWSWYNKPIDWTNESEVGTAQLAYNKEMYNRFINAGYTPEEAARYVKTIGFDESKTSGIPNAYDKKAGKYVETRVVFDVPKKPGKTENTEENRDEIQTNELNTSSVTSKRPIGFYPQDVLNTAAAVGDLASINKYNPRMAQFVPEPMEPTFYDPNRELANNAEMANIASANLAQFTGPQAFNTRFSDVQGKSLANAANVLGRYNNLNVGVANQFEQANKQINNEANFRNALMANDFYDKTVIANQQFDNSKRAGRREAVDYVNAALENRFITDQMNSLYPNFFVDPAALKTYYKPAQKLPPGQKGKDLAKYLTEMGIDIKNPTVQAAMVKSIFGDIDVDERGNILAAQSAMSNRRKTKGS
jgi:hypothetical protein